MKIFGQFEGGAYLGGCYGCLKSRNVFLAVDGDQTYSGTMTSKIQICGVCKIEISEVWGIKNVWI